jgi:hypothetical protein
MRPTRICLRTHITTQVIGANRGNLENSRASGHKAIALLEEMGLLDSTIIIITDDHGMRTPTTALLKQTLLIIKDKDEEHQRAYKLYFAKRPRNELDDLKKGPEQ